LERKEEYVKALQMLLPQGQIPSASNGQYILKWIEEKLKILEDKSLTSGQPFDKNNFESFKREITQNFKTIVTINVKEAIRIVDLRFGANHKDIIDQLARDPQEQLLYLDTLLEKQGNHIQDTIRCYIQESLNPIEAKKCIEILKLHLRLSCQIRPDHVIALIEKIVGKSSYYPIEDCLLICQEFRQIEAIFLLSKKLGKYYDSVS
jgi:hypothetical protein